MRGIVTLILCLFVTPIRAQTPIDIGDGMPLLSLAAISETHAGSPLDSIDSVSQQDDWKGPGEEFRFGLRGEPVWIHFRVRNPSADP
ncbi:MAG TPA: hypothetical protein PLD60_15815, partial [Leptospiraceae bacterium]|nr:hypothetical protein [Leptospiraceae bacterium]